jgi:DNA-binding GntR family transcriptional regulator
LQAVDSPGLTNITIAVERRESPQLIYGYLRHRIVSNQLAAKTPLNQRHLAQQFGVSRGPIREALRMLQAEGLVEVERNQRWLVASIDPADVEEVYVQRILLEAVGVNLTVPELTEVELSDAEMDLRLMQYSLDDLDSYLHAHKRFHRVFVSRLPEGLMRRADLLTERAERYQRFFATQLPSSVRQDSFDDHKVILGAAIERDAGLTSQCLAQHYAAVAQRVLARVDEPYDDASLRMAQQMVSDAAGCHYAAKPVLASPRPHTPVDYLNQSDVNLSTTPNTSSA